MAKMKSSLTNMVLILVSFALVIAALLAWVNHITECPIAAKAEQTLAAGIKAVMGSDEVKVTANDEITKEFDGKEYQFVVHKVDNAKGEPLGAAVETTTLGFADNVQVLVGFAPDGKILGYTVLKHSETPGLGAKAGQWFQADGKASIIGLNPAEEQLAVTKDGGKVDAITASTITSRAFLKAVNQAYAVYAEQGGKKVDVQSGASTKHVNGQKAEEAETADNNANH